MAYKDKFLPTRPHSGQTLKEGSFDSSVSLGNLQQVDPTFRICGALVWGVLSQTS